MMIKKKSEKKSKKLNLVWLKTITTTTITLSRKFVAIEEFKRKFKSIQWRLIISNQFFNSLKKNTADSPATEQ